VKAYEDPLDSNQKGEGLYGGKVTLSFFAKRYHGQPSCLGIGEKSQDAPNRGEHRRIGDEGRGKGRPDEARSKYGLGFKLWGCREQFKKTAWATLEENATSENYGK